jgi:hypothetical protein
MPRLWRIVWVVEQGDSDDQLCGNDGDSGAYRNPGKHVCHATTVALENIQ